MTSKLTSLTRSSKKKNSKTVTEEQLRAKGEVAFILAGSDDDFFGLDVQ